jgi:hypothetical protein
VRHLQSLAINTSQCAKKRDVDPLASHGQAGRLVAVGPVSCNINAPPTEFSRCHRTSKSLYFPCRFASLHLAQVTKNFFIIGSTPDGPFLPFDCFVNHSVLI